MRLINHLFLTLIGDVQSKSKTITLSLIGLLLMCLSSCTKEGTCLQGRVLENGSETPLEGVEVVITASKSDGLFEPVATWEAGRAITNSKGRFSIEVEDADFYNVVSFNKEGYFPTLSINQNDPKGLSQRNSLSDNGERENPDFFLDPEGFISISLIDDIQIGKMGDIIEVRFPGRGYLEFFSTNHTEIYYLRANKVYSYTYAFTSNPFKKDSVFVQPFDTTKLEIRF